MSNNDSLRGKLRKARKECPERSDQYIIPRYCQWDLITEEAIRHQTGLQGVTIEAEEARVIRDEYLQLFGILAYINKVAEIKAFMAEGITDKALPLKRDSDEARERSYLLTRQGGENIFLLDYWDDNLCEEFYKAQRMMTAPVFKLGHHYDFNDSTILPLFTLPSTDGYRGGGYSEIQIRYIHPSHHEFGDNSQPDVSVKARSVNTTLC